MAVQFILGRSGTGKTHCCVKAIIDTLLAPGETGPLLYLVPEQATYQAERAILLDGRLAGYSRLHVLSFDRLGFLVQGKKSLGTRISEFGKVMLIHKILQTNKAKLKLFGSSANRPGLAEEMKRVIEELQRYDRKAEEVLELAAQLQKEEAGALSGLKFADIGLIYSEYQRLIEGRFVNPDTQLTSARQVLAETDFIKGARLWVDGFAGFTAQELMTLVELLKVVSEAQIALCLDPQKIDPALIAPQMPDSISLFSPTERTYAELVGLIRKCGLKLSGPICLEKPWRFTASPELGHIERNLFAPDSSAKIKQNKKVRIISASNTRAEVQFLAREILNLVKKENLRFRDIAVVTPELTGYQHYIRAMFSDYGIPFFIDMRRPLRQHPLIELILSALRAVSYNFCNSDIFTFLKTDLVPIRRSNVDMLENYCLAFGIDREDWKRKDDWQFAGSGQDDFNEQQINKTRREAVGALLEFEKKLLGTEEKITPEEFIQVVFNFLKELGIRGTLSEWIAEAIKASDLEKADEHRQCYDRLVSVFDELAQIFTGEKMTVEEYLSIVESAFTNMTLAFIPPRLEEVLVGSIERSRHPELKVVFLIGASQKRFPVPMRPEGIITDQDRITAGKKELLLAETVEQQLITRQYLAYIAFTRASQLLYITYPLADEKGNALAPSDFLADVESLFENFSEEFFEAEDYTLDKVHSEAELTDLLCTKLGWDAANVSTQLDGLPTALSEDKQLAHTGKTVCYAINYDNTARLDKKLVDEQLTGVIRKSITELASFAACPYQHFSKYTLGLKSRKVFKLEPLDLGIFYHNILDGLTKRLREEGKDFATTRDNDLLAFLHTEITKRLTSDSFISTFTGHSAHNAFIVDSASRNLEDCVLAIAQMARAGKFQTVETELTFGEASEGLGQFELLLSNNRRLYLRGKIDRLDTGSVGGKNLALVFDYKRSSRGFNWAQFLHGLDLQLPAYLLVLRNKSIGKAKELQPAGGFYIPIEVKPEAGEAIEIEGQAEKFKHKARGIVNGEFTELLDGSTTSGWSKFYNMPFTKSSGPYGYYNNSGVLKPEDFEMILKFTETKITKLAEESISGKIDVNPYRLRDHSPCRWCEYRAVCRFEWPINDYNNLEAVSKEQVLEMIGAGNGS